MTLRNGHHVGGVIIKLSGTLRIPLNASVLDFAYHFTAVEAAIRRAAQTYNYAVFEDIRELDCHANYSINEPQIALRSIIT